MDWPIIALTIVIAAATCVQALVGYRLWRLQREIEDQRKQTSVSVVLELRRPDPSKPQHAWFRLENASAIGILNTHLVLVARSKGRTADPVKVDLRLALGPYGSREKEVSPEILEAAYKVERADPAWMQDGQMHSVVFRLTPHYDVDGKSREGQHAFFQLDFSGHNMQNVLALDPSDAATT